jgi:hypothetical protein
MRTLPLVLLVVLVNDAVLLLALDVPVPAWLGVLGGALALTVPLFAVADATADGSGPPTRAELEGELDALRERVDDLDA